MTPRALELPVSNFVLRVDTDKLFIDKHIILAVAVLNMFPREKILRGITTLLILKYLLEKPKHGYLLQREVSNDLQRDLPNGAIYTLLKSLESREFVRSRRDERIGGRIIKRYEITREGKDFLKRHEEPLKTVRNVLGSLIPAVEKIR